MEKRPARDRSSVAGMDIKLSTSFITVNDPDAALAFYRDVLGLEVRMDVPQGEFRWITVGSPTQPDVGIVLSNYVDGSPEDIEVIRALVAKGGMNAAHFSSSDVDAVFAKATEAGAEIVSEVADQPWGVRDCAFRDPSGNLVRVDQA